MPTYKISQLTTATAVSATNQFEINQNGTSKSVEVSVIDVYIKSISNLPVVVSVSSASDALRITQTGTGKALVVEDSANPDATPFVIDASGNVGIGTASPDAALTVNTVASFGAGAAALPSIAATGDLNTGMWFPAADTLAATTGGTERLRIDSSGNVGIGTSSPSQKLEVYAAANSLQIESVVRNDQAGTGVAAIGFNVSSGAAGEATSTKAGIGLVRSNAYGVGSLCFYNNGTTSAGDFTTSDERMRIDSSGNVGIGTSSPSALLHVNGNAKFGSLITTGLGVSTGDAGLEVGGERSGNGNSIIDLHAAAGTDFSARLLRTSGANGQFEIINSGTGALVFATSSTERARITSGGNFFVNATALPAGTHSVNGTIYTQGFYSNYGIGSHSGVGGAYQTNAINFQWNGSAVRLWVDTTDLGSITVSSDYRVKKDIKTQAATALDRVLQIRPVTYTYADYAPFSWKADGVSREGFIAHELAEIIPSAVEGAKDEPNKVQSLKLDALCSVLVKAIQELKADFDAYKAAHP